MLSADEIFEVIKKAKGFKTDAELGKFLGFSGSNIGMQRKRNAIPFEAIMKACPEVDLNKLFYNQQFVISENQPSQNEMVKEPSATYGGKGIDVSLLQLDIHKSIETNERYSRIMERLQDSNESSQSQIDRLTRLLEVIIGEQGTSQASEEKQRGTPQGQKFWRPGKKSAPHK